MCISRTRVGVALSVSVAVGVSLVGTAGARLPDGEIDGGARAQLALSFADFNLGSYLPENSGLSSVDGWIDQQMTRRVDAREARFAGSDAVARAIARRNR